MEASATSGVPRANLARLHADHTLDAWDPSTNGTVNALAVSGTTVYAGGNFTFIGGQSRNRIAAIDGTSGVVNAWNPGADSTVNALAASGTAIFVGGSFHLIGGSLVDRLAALDPSTGNAFGGPDADGVVRALALSGTRLYVGGDFSLLGAAPQRARGGGHGSRSRDVLEPGRERHRDSSGRERDDGLRRRELHHPQRLGPQPDRRGEHDDRAPTTWDPNANDKVNALAVSGTTVYAGGDFTNIGGQARSRVAALDRAVNTSNALVGWNPGTSSSVNALALSGTTLYAGRLQHRRSRRARNRLAAIDLASGQPTAWNPNANGQVQALVVSGATVYACGLSMRSEDRRAT